MTKKADPALDEASVGDDTILADAPDAVEADHGLAQDDPAVTGIPRDERVDSIDRATGTLSDEAQALRREAATPE